MGSMEILGHQWAVGLLGSHQAQDRVRHAYLFTGPDEVGKRTLAQEFAQALNCENPPKAGEVCGECRACRLIPEWTYPDLHVVQAEEIGGTLKVDQIRQLQRQLALTPFEGRFRVALLLRFHEATDEAANALLKTLEEPADNVILLLTARSIESLLPTIVSRCEVVALRALPIAELSNLLIQRGVSEEETKLISGLAGGRPGRALRLMEDPELIAIRETHLRDLLRSLEMDRSERFDLAQSLTKAKDAAGSRKKSVEALEIWLSLFRDVMALSVGSETTYQNPDRMADIERLAARVGQSHIIETVEAIQRSLGAIHLNANVRLTIETLMLDLPRLRESSPIEQ